MAEFAVRTHQLTVEPHPDAEFLECARIGGYYTVVRKGEFRTGDIAAYIPEASVLPDRLIEGMGLKGKLAGPDFNRVHAVKLRGVLSQGLVYRMPGRPTGTDVTDELGIVKYEAVPPPHMQGEMRDAFGGNIRYEIEDIKGRPEMFAEGEMVTYTEKIHGTWCCIGWQDGVPVIASKQISARGLAFVTDDGVNDGNIYVECFRRNRNALATVGERTGAENYHVLGEIYGRGVQDLQYAMQTQGFRVFDLYVGNKEQGKFLDQHEMREAVAGLFETVPLLYRGPFNQESLAEHSSGRSALGGNNREGVVIRPATERGHPLLDRVIGKSLSEKHLLRKGATEYN